MGRSLAGAMASTVFAALDGHSPFYFRLVVLILKAQHFYSMPHTRWQDPVPQNRRPESDPRISLFEIRLDQPSVVFQGHADTAAPFLVKGTVVMCVAEPLRMRRIKMELVGKQVVKTINDKHRREWFGEEWELWSSVGGLGQDLDPESYQWPFQRILPGSLPESVIGIDRSWLRYQFMVTLERGPLGKDWYEKKDIRVIRTPDPTSPALTRDTFLEGQWKNILDYTISAPTAGVIFGTQIKVDFTFVPLLKGFNVAEVVIQLVEEQGHYVRGTWHDWHKNIDRTVFHEIWRPPETELVDIQGREGYRHTKLLRLPKSLKDCTQSLNVNCLTVVHTLEFFLKLRKASGGLSKRESEMPIIVFISPDLTFENDILVSQPPMDLDFDAIRNISPPFYGEHTSDQIYCEIDGSAGGSGFLTPDRGTALGGVSTWIRRRAAGAMSAGRRSGTNTPFSARSRNSSVENLGSMSAISSLFETLAHNANVVLGSRNRNRNRTRNRDRNRSSDLEVSSEGVHESVGSDTAVELGVSSSVHSPLASRLIPGNISSIVQQTIPENPPTPSEPIIRTSDNQQITDYDSVELLKCPSYDTARRARPHGLINDGLPSYEAAISATGASAYRAEPALTGASAAASPQEPQAPQGRHHEQQVQLPQAEAHSRSLQEEASRARE